MPPPMWQSLQGCQQLQPHQHYHSSTQQQHLYPQSNEIAGRVGMGRQRASTMTDKLITVPVPSASSSSIAISPAAPDTTGTQDYFTYLSAQNNHTPHFINIQSSSPPPFIPQVDTSEITIPEIRLAPPQNNEDRISSPEFITAHLWHSNSPTSPVYDLNNNCRSRSNSTAAHSLAPPSSVLLENDDNASFFSAQQSLFEISPSNSFDHQNQLLFALINNARHEDRHYAATGSPFIVTDMPHLNIPSLDQHRNEVSDLSSLLYSSNRSFHHHSRDNSDYYSLNSKHFYPSISNIAAAGSSASSSNWNYIIDEIAQVLLPTLQGWKSKSFFSKISALVAAPLVLIFTLTLPVAEIEQIKIDDIEVAENDNEEEEVIVATTDANDNTKNYLAVPTALSDNDLVAAGKVVVDDVDTRQGWNKYLLILQSVVSTTFIFSVLAG
jgi:hypothetical protein